MTIAIMLGLLLTPYLILTGLARIRPQAAIPVQLRGRIGLASVFLFTAMGHFVRTEPMAQMLPPWMPGRTAVVYSTGVLEIAGAIGLLVPWPAIVRLTGICLIAFMIVVFPANIYSAVSQSGLGSYDMGPWYLLIRGPMQVLLIGWAYWYAVRSPAPRRSAATESPKEG